MKKSFIFYYGMLMMACNNGKSTHDPLTGYNAIKNNDSVSWPAHFGLGKPATPEDIARWDIDVRPDGTGLPAAGSGNVQTGRRIYITKCAACHGTGTEPANAQLPAPVLFTNAAGKEIKTIGNYWPYATTIFDYVRRAMPYNAPGTLSNEEVYHITAYLLYANEIIKENDLINAQTLPKVIMPALQRFVVDDRKGGAEVK